VAGPPKYDLVGGRLCLDFCNTTSERTGERLQDYGDLVGWSWRTGILNAEEATRLLRTGGRTPTEALRVHERALALRSALYRVFAAVAESVSARGADLEVLNAAPSRNRTRRWCDMRICGNRAKARRHHARTRAGAA